MPKSHLAQGFNVIGPCPNFKKKEQGFRVVSFCFVNKLNIFRPTTTTTIKKKQTKKRVKIPFCYFVSFEEYMRKKK